jgi:hypothetical protein
VDFNVKASIMPIIIRVYPPILASVPMGNIAKMQPTKIISENIIMSLRERVLINFFSICYLVFQIKYVIMREL